MEPGTSACVQFRLRDPVLLLPGDRFIIRQVSPVITIGGGRVLENWVPRHSLRRMAREDVMKALRVLQSENRESILETLLRNSPGGCLGAEDLIARTGWLLAECSQTAQQLQKEGKASVLSEKPLLVAEEARLEQLRRRTVETLEKFHKQNPLLPGMSKEALRTKLFARAYPALAEPVLKKLADLGKIAVAGELVKLGGHKIVLKDEEQQAKQQIARAFERAGLRVPAVKDVLGKLPLERQRAERILKILLQEKLLIRVSDDLVFHADAIGKLRQTLAQYKTTSDRIKVGAFKDLAQISRKYAIPLLEYLDREHVTRRAGDERILL